MKTKRSDIQHPLAVTLFARALGQRVRTARIARGVLQADMAAQALLSVDTLRRIEAGAPSVRLVDVAHVLWAQDDQSLMHALANAQDELVLQAQSQALPQRVRLPRRKASA